VPHVVIASDAAWIQDEVRNALPGTDVTFQILRSGRAVRTAVAERATDLVVCDFQVGTMGGMAVTMDLRLEQSGGRLPAVPVLLLLDRPADVFLASRCGADGYLVKPLDPIRLRKAMTALLAGGRFEDRVVMADASTNYRSTADSSAR
jgi:DNA-binding NarL/FixJ family response regulator